MHYLYIIYSLSCDSYYTGETSNITERLDKHNTGYYSKSSTKKATDWEFSLVHRCKTKEDAKYLESFIKRMKSRTFIEKVILNPNILVDILDKK